MGLFNLSGTLHDVVLTNVSITGNNYTGGLAGAATSAVSRCTVTGTINADPERR